MKTVRGEFLSINKKLTFTACDVRKNGKIISLHINTPLSDNLTAGELIAIVPDGFRPTFNDNVPVTINEQKNNCENLYRWKNQSGITMDPVNMAYI